MELKEMTTEEVMSWIELKFAQAEKQELLEKKKERRKSQEEEISFEKNGGGE